MNGTPIRQEYLETAIEWINDTDKDKYNDSIEQYMAIYQHDHNANELRLYFRNVINWTQLTFSHYRREMKGIDWGYIYNKFGKEQFSTNELEDRIAKLMQDDDVTNKKGIYAYVMF